MRKEIEGVAALKELHSDKLNSLNALKKANNILGPTAVVLGWLAPVVSNRPEAVLLFSGAMVVGIVNRLRLDKLTKRADRQYRYVRRALGRTPTQTEE